MTILRHDRRRTERRGRAQDGAHIVRVRHLIEDEYRPLCPFGEHVFQEYGLKRLDLEDEPLVRRIGGDQSREIGRFANFHGDIGRQVKLLGDLACHPQLPEAPRRIGERCLYRVAAIEARQFRRAAALGPSRSPASRHFASFQS